MHPVQLIKKSLHLIKTQHTAEGGKYNEMAILSMEWDLGTLSGQALVYTIQR